MKPNGIKAIKRRMKMNRRKALRMFQQDYSYRQIQKELGYKSVKSIQDLLKDNTRYVKKSGQSTR